MNKTPYAIVAALAALLTFVVITFGAYVRLSDAGLGCPDWPGCYGRLAVPESREAIAEANAAYPQRHVEPAKAWKEMVHRYLATGLGVLILMLAVAAWYYRDNGIPVMLPTSLVALVIFQGLLGMWTVTLLVKPLIVTAHLVGGLVTLILLGWLVLRVGRLFLTPLNPSFVRLRPWIWLGFVLLWLQILLGGWTSTNYAAAACVEFPTCFGGMWWPTTDFHEAFTLWRGLGINYEFGVLESPARTAIHLAHRVGALVVLVYLGVLSVQVMQRAASRAQVGIGMVLHFLVIAQVGLGIAVVLHLRQLPVAVAHNGGAALLLLTLVTLIHVLKPPANVAETATPSTAGGHSA
ncbi:cytochrome c oxidase assembly protein subunit 15 [Gammaproteobacteria bacterium]